MALVKRIDTGRRADFPTRMVDTLEISEEVQRALTAPHSHTHREKGSDPVDGTDIDIDATDVDVEILAGATYDDVQDFINFFGDRTLLSGGAISDNGDGDATVALGTAWCKATDSDTAVGLFFDFSADTSVTLTDLTTNFLYVDYNAGTPQIVIATSILTYGFKQDHVFVGTAYREDTTLHIHQSDNIGIQSTNRAHMHWLEHFLVHRVSGIVTSSTGTRNLSVTAGVVYAGLTRNATLAFDTSRSGTADADETNKLHDADSDFTAGDVGKEVHNTTDDIYGLVTAYVDSGELTLLGDTFPDGNEAYHLDWFSYWYYDGDLGGGAAWVEVPGQVQIDNTQYNAVATGLATLTANRYGVHWVYMDNDGHHLHIVYGIGDYTANQVEEAGVPSSLPNIVSNYCVLIAKIIVQKSSDTLIILYPWTIAFQSTLATDHNALANLTVGDVHTQYVGTADTDWVDKTHLSQDFGATGTVLGNVIISPIMGFALRIDHAVQTNGSGLFNALINAGGSGGLTATNVPYDNDSNEDMFNGLWAYDGSNYWGQIILWNTTRANSRKIVSVDRTNNAIATTSSTDDWADDDTITLQSQTNAEEGYFDLLLSDNIATTDSVAYVDVAFYDSENTYDNLRRLKFHPFETYNSAKNINVFNTQALDRHEKVFPLKVVSQTITMNIERGCNDVFIFVKVTGRIENADT